MRTLPLQFFSFAVVLGLMGCNGDDPGPIDSAGGTYAIGGSGGGSQSGSPGGSTVVAKGGATSAAGGKSSTGGASASGGTSASKGGSDTKGGGTASGGTSPLGGSTSRGGSTAVGGGGTVKKFVGNITTNNSVDSNGLNYAKYWDQITPENAGKWGSVQSSASSQFNWSTLDSIYSYTQKNNIIFKQHVFVWGQQQPSGSLTENHVKTWMKEFCKRFPQTKLIDVVNEPPPHTTPSYVDAIGGGTNGTWQWITNSFKWAREACPDAILILNDYNNIEWPNDNQHFIDIVKAIKKGGAPVDAVGAQAHDLDHAQVTTATMKQLLAKLNTDTGLPVYITEYDISTSDDNAQLAKYKEQVPFFLETDYIKGITIWGWIYGTTWSQAPDSGLVKSGKSRPAMTWLMQQLGRTAP